MEKYYRYKKDIVAELAKIEITPYTCKTKKKNALSQGTFTKLKRHEELTLNTAAKIAQLLDCQLSDLFEVIPDDNG